MFNSITYSNIDFLNIQNHLGSDTGLYINFNEFLIERGLSGQYKDFFYHHINDHIEIFNTDVLVNSEYLYKLKLEFLNMQASSRYGEFNNLYRDKARFEIVNNDQDLKILDEIIIHSDNGDYLLRYSHTKEKSTEYNAHELLFKLFEYHKGKVTILVDYIPVFYRNGDKYIYTLLQARDYFKERIKEYEKRA